MNESLILQAWMKDAKRAVFFGGAGVSTESGIPDYRSVDGLYSQKYPYPPETMLSHSFFVHHTEEFFSFYKAKLVNRQALPNAAHLKLAQWEKEGRLAAIVTQNVDGLHQLAGSKNVFELHGSVEKNACVKCGRPYDLDFVMSGGVVPRCACGGVIKPRVVLYEEGLDQDVLQGALAAIARSDVLIIGGTSLAVYPAAGLIDAYRGQRLVLINKTPTPVDGRANLVLYGAIGEILSKVE